MSDGMNLTDRAYAFIHQKLTGGQLSPGMRLTNRSVAKEMGISLTPIHGAFNRLISEGLLDYRPGIGVFVPSLERGEIAEIYEFRETLECAAVAKMCGRMSDEMVAHMKRCNDEIAAAVEQLTEDAGSSVDRDHMERLRLLDTEFHMTLLRAAGNRRALQAVEDIWVRMCMQVYDNRLMNFTLGNLTRTIDEHQCIFDALCKGDAEESRRLLSKHIRTGCQVALEAYDRRYMEKGTHHLGARSAAGREDLRSLQAGQTEKGPDTDNQYGD